METNRRSILGLILVIVGVYFLLDNFDLIPFTLPSYIFQWPMILIAIGIVNIFSGNRRGALLFFGLGISFIVVDQYNLDFADIWPVILIIVGISFFLRNRAFSNTEELNSPTLDAIAIFAGSKKNVLSKDFRGGKITTLFGGNVIDLRKADLASSGAVLDVSTIFGGTEIIVPADWSIESHVTPILGGFDDKRLDINKVIETKRLKIHGTVIFGGVDVKD